MLLPDLKWLPDMLRLPARIFAGLFLFFATVLVLDHFALFPPAALHPLAWALVVLGALLFGFLCFALFIGIIVDALARRHKRTLMSERHNLRRADRERETAEYQAAVLKRLDYLSTEELSIIAGCLRKNERTFLTYAHSPPVANMMASGFVGTMGGAYHRDHYPYYFGDFVWEELLRRRDEFIAKDDENTRRAKLEEERALRGRRP
jgi:hypothetical protein